MSEHCGQHWGQISTAADPASAIAAIERAEVMKVFAMKPIVGDHPSADRLLDEGVPRTDLKLSDVPIGNPVMLHTIRLSQFLKQLDDNSGRHKLSADSVPQPITCTDTPPKSLEALNGRQLNPIAIKELVRRAVTIIAVFHGYDMANKSALDLLVDTLNEYLTSLCRTIRKTTDSLELRSSNDFIDTIDRVFHDMNVSDFEALRQYDSDIRAYNHNLIKEVNKKLGITDSMANHNKVGHNLPVESDCDEPNLSTPTQPETKIDSNLSLKSLLNSFKSGSTDDNHLFDLTP